MKTIPTDQHESFQHILSLLTCILEKFLGGARLAIEVKNVYLVGIGRSHSNVISVQGVIGYHWQVQKNILSHFDLSVQKLTRNYKTGH